MAFFIHPGNGLAVKAGPAPARLDIEKLLGFSLYGTEYCPLNVSRSCSGGGTKSSGTLSPSCKRSVRSEPRTWLRSFRKVFLLQNRGSRSRVAMADELAVTTEALRLDDSKLDDGLEEGEIVEKPVDRPAEVKKHPLEHSWTFWFDNPNGKQKQATWGSSLRSVYTFHTVEEFWCLYNNVLQPSKLTAGADFHCFKSGIEPKWEDPKCAYGGKWTAQPPRSGGKATLDTYWLHTLLAMIGEQFEESDEICGAVVSVRRSQDKIAIWTKTASNEAAQVSIGKQWKDVLDYNDKLGYLVHDDAKRQDKAAKNRYNV